MDQGGDGIPNEENDNTEVNISDVLEAISSTDPERSMDAMHRHERRVNIVEQPASKALRFRYECEGRSAGSIPGVNSTPEKKTYPTIEIVGWTGKAVVVVSCVTKDKPYRPHPHNLVGREQCKKGLCTVYVDGADNKVTFNNLGIQCVRRRDIAEALKLRQEQNVDPFKTGFDHKNQPQSIDLNAVRLCFQVFLFDERSQSFRHGLAPVVSDIIYDKKAMSDLLIMRMSSCSGTAKGGTELILLCEKVIREETAVVFYETEGDRRVWEASAHIILVHKQVAIAVTTPPYRRPDTDRHARVHIQLRRTTDGACSPPVDFEYLPELLAGTARKPLPDLAALTLLLRDTNNNTDKPTDNCRSSPIPVHSPSPSVDVVDVVDVVDAVDVVLEDVQVLEDSNERTLDDLLDQVAELDEIYTENRTRLENASDDCNRDLDADAEDFNDAGTYTSLQLAFKNPIRIAEPDTTAYEDVQVQTYRGPIIEFSPLKRDDEEAPPLPPKRVRKAPSVEGFKTSQTSVDSFLKPGRQLPITRTPEPQSELCGARSEPALPPAPKKRSFLSRLFRRRDKSPAPSVKSEGRKEKKSKPVGRSVSSVSGVRPSKFKSAVSHASLKDNASGAGLSYADSVTHISLHGEADEGGRSASQNSLRRGASVGPLPPTDGGTILVAESVLALDASAFRKLQDDLELTDAEHYALYMAVAPHATASEFDETSCYYAPVDGNTSYLKSKRRKTMNTFLQSYEQERYQTEVKPIKAEPRDKTPPHQMSSPPQVFPHLAYDHDPMQDQHQYQQWQMPPEQMQANLSVPGPSHLNPFAADMAWTNANYGQMPMPMAPISPNMQTVSPNMQLSPNMQVNPNLQAVSPMHVMPIAQAMSPHAGMGQGALSPHAMAQGGMSPHTGMAQGGMSPHTGMAQGGMSPHTAMGQGGMSPHAGMPQGGIVTNMGHVSPSLGHISPSLGHISPNPVQQSDLTGVSVASGDTGSFSRLLLEGDTMPQLNSTELSGLTSMLGERLDDNISDGLNKLSF